MKLDISCFRYLTSVEWRVLIAVEMGTKNHEVVPTVLIARIANLRRHGIHQILLTLLKYKLIVHDGSVYDGYKLSYLGYDLLALRALVSRGSVQGIGARIGVGKESDVHVCENGIHKPVILKIHRLGRISFRTVKKNRDYLGNRNCASWMYMARLAASKEYAYMKALYQHGFPVPEPLDLNRHILVMSHVDARPLAHASKLNNPHKVLEELMSLIVRFAEAGLIHGDFNAFNLLLDDNEHVTVIDFPQIVRVHHPDAEFYFDRDVKCIRSLFKSRYRIDLVKYPQFHQIKKPALPHYLAIRKNLLQEEEVLERFRRLTVDPSFSESECSSHDLRASEKVHDMSNNGKLVQEVKQDFVVSESSNGELDEVIDRDLKNSKENVSCTKHDIVSLDENSFYSINDSEKDQTSDSESSSFKVNKHNALDEVSDLDSSTVEVSCHSVDSSVGKKFPVKRLDHTWTPIIRRRPAETRKPRQAAQKRSKKKEKLFSKKAKEQRNLIHQTLNFIEF